MTTSDTTNETANECSSVTTDSDSPRVADMENELASTAYESIRAINHLTIDGKAIPAPEVYTLLGNLKCLGWSLDQALRQLSRALAKSLTMFAVYEDEGGNPEESVAYAMDSLRTAAEHAAHIGRLLEGAQGDISRQGVYRSQNTREGR
jgi:hypothetical protein